MTQSPASSTPAARSRKKRRQPSSGYLFVITGLAVFFAALVLGLGFRPRDPVKAIVAPTVPVDRTSTPARTFQSVERLEAIAVAIQSEAAVGQTLELLGKFDGPPLDRSLTAAKFLQDFHVSIRPAATAGRHEILLDYQGSAAGATEIVNQLASLAVQQYERQFEQPARQKQFQAQQEATSAERKAAAALRRYELFISRLQPAVEEAATAGSPSLTELASEAESPGEPAMVQNPVWRELADQQQRLTRRRGELLEQMTSEHPVIRQLNDDLALLDQSLSQTPQLIENPSALEATAAAIKRPTSGENIATTELPGEGQIIDETQRLRSESVAADQLVLKRQADLQASAIELSAAQAGKLEVLRWAEKPAMMRGSDGVTLIVAGLLAWLIGSAVAARGMPADPTFTNPEEAATQLATPVLAVLPANEQCPTAIYPQLPRSTRFVARASEFALAAMLFMAVTLVIADQGFRSQLLSHPLSSIPHGIERFRDMMLS